MSNNTKTEAPKTEAPKTEAPKATHEMPNPFAAFASFDPTGMFAQSQQIWQKAFADAQARSHVFVEQFAAMEKEFVTRAQAAVTQWAQLTNDAIAYGAQLSAEARKLGVEAARKMTVA